MTTTELKTPQEIAVYVFLAWDHCTDSDLEDRIAAAIQAERDRANAAIMRLRDVLTKIVNYVAVGYLQPHPPYKGLIQLEINGHAAYRPIEEPARDELGQLFTYLLNAAEALCDTDPRQPEPAATVEEQP